MSRPEAATEGRADKFYNSSEAQSYSQSNRLRRVQLSLGNRSLQLLQLPPNVPQYILDIGCGTGISGVPLSRAGHIWVGTDISISMLQVAAKERGSKGTDVLISDMGHGLPFRDDMFDAAISVSALQWLCYEAKHHLKSPRDRLLKFFKTLRRQLKEGGRAVLQFYPEQPQDATAIRDAAVQCGFRGGIVVDYPSDLNAKKYYLVIDSIPREDIGTSENYFVHSKVRVKHNTMKGSGKSNGSRR
jgi:18S rRNA (guanine1575-N7)-methyltransferase